MISTTQSGSFDNLEKFLRRDSRKSARSVLESYGAKGVNALAKATPVDSSLTASSWAYRINETQNSVSLEWYNTNGDVAILIQYGHGTGTGGYVQGRDYINPAMRPVFDQIAQEIGKVVTQ